MATTEEDLKRWFKEGQRKKATHMIVACDTMDWEDYPVYVEKGQNAVKIQKDEYSGQNMQKTMEVYDLRQDFNWNQARQTNGRCWNF